MSTVNEIRELINVNYDARNYFFSKADERWLTWLWDNGLLDEIKKSTAEAEQYEYKMPELDYLVRMAKVVPDKVTNIILAIESNSKHFNAEVLNRFLWLAGDLPPEQLKKIVPKVRDEDWVFLTRKFLRSGFEFHRIVEVLREANDTESLVTIAEAILRVRTKEEMVEITNGITTDNPFYLSDLGYAEILPALAAVQGEQAERVLKVTTDVMTKVVLLGNKEPKSETFQVDETFYLFDVDFFELQVADKKHLSYRDDVRDLAATIKTLIDTCINERCDNVAEVNRLYERYIDPLPDSRSMWRLRLYTLSRCPVAFTNMLKDAFFRLFKTEKYHDVESGTEYKKALRVAFHALSEQDQRAYVTEVFKYFKAKSDADPDKGWHKRHGWEILSSITAHLTEDEKQKCKQYFDRDCNPDYQPEPDVGQIQSGMVAHRAPVKVEDFTVAQIVEHIGTEWTAEALAKKYKDDDFFERRGVEGLGDSLKEDLKKRSAEYTAHAEKFFNRETIYPFYTYSFLRSVEEILRSKESVDQLNWEHLFILFESIRHSGTATPFKRKDEKDSWLSSWISVHDAVADILLHSLGNGDNVPFDFSKYRDSILGILTYLFMVDDPQREDEKSDRGDLYHVAINSVRGRAFQVLTQFVYHDGKSFSKEDVVKIKDDVKDCYQSLLAREETMSIRFMFGHYLGVFYFRDKQWIDSLLSSIFPEEKEDTNLFYAAFEGYLLQTLYNGLFEHMERYYAHSIEAMPENFTKRKYVKDIDEAVAAHLALAFAHFEDFTSESALFKQMWATNSAKQCEEFVSFLGKHCISQNSAAGEQWFKDEKVDKEKVMAFWDWLLDKGNTVSPSVFGGFSYWVNPSMEVLPYVWLAPRLAKSIECSEGQLSWSYGLFQQLPALAQYAPTDALNILEHYFFIAKDTLNPHQDVWIHIDTEIKEALTLLWKNNDTKQGTYDFVNRLIEHGGQRFWLLKDVLKD